ncbi:MAG: sodium:solute symporter [Coriobacteriales bacterium]|jgi:SSS family solute:Na+ symporter/sodium/proline symporter|nr:sodium:solute symporter [Coriobacteriales bacterium]
MFLKILMMVLFFGVTVYIGFATRKSTGNVDGFVLGGRKVGPWLSAFAYGTSYFSAVVFIGYAGQFGWKYGMAALWIGLGNAFIGSMLAWYVLGARTRAMTHHLGAQTMPEFFGARFNSSALRIAAAMIIFIFLIPYTASVYNGLSRLFFMAFAIPYEWAIIGMAVLTCIYVVLGGYMATAVNDFVQGCIMLVGIVAVIVAVLLGHGGFSEAVVALSQIPNDPAGAAGAAGTAGMSGAFTSLFGPDLVNLLGVVILTSLGTWGLPQMISKFYAIKSTSVIKRGAIISTLFALVVAGGSYFLGGFGRLVAADVPLTPAGSPVYDAVVPTLLSNMPDLLIGLTVVLVLSASMSTLSSLVLTSSSTLTLDFIKGTVARKMTEKSQLLSIRVLIVVFVVISAVIALVQYNSSVTFIAQLMSISWGVLAGSFLAPFLYGLYWKRVTKGAVWACFVWAVGLVCSNMVFGFIASPINAGALAMVGGLIIVPLVSLITPKPDAEKTDRLFAESYVSLHDNPLDNPTDS